MEQIIRLQYINAQLNIGLVNWREAWLLSVQNPIQLYTETYKGKLVFRIPGTSRRISYHRLKKGLIKKIMLIEEKLPF